MDVLVTTPSLAVTVAGHTPPLKRLVLLGEPCPAALRSRLHSGFAIEPVSIYAASEAVIGFEAPGEPGNYCWNPERLHLEVLRPEGTVASHGRGELLVTRRYGVANPLLRYRLGDLVELDAGRVRILGRIGHAFGLCTGVKVSRLLLERYLDALPAPIASAQFTVEHSASGDHLVVELVSCGAAIDADAAANLLLASSLEIADAAACAHLRVDVVCRQGPPAAKRRVDVAERPWAL